MDIRRTALSALLGLLLAGPAFADALYPTKQEMLLLTRRVAALERDTNSYSGPVLKADAPSGNVESITNYATLYFKPRDYAAFRLTNDGLEAHLQVSVNGDFLLSSNLPSAGQMLYASGSSYTSLYWKSSLLGHVTNVDVRASDEDSGYVTGSTFVVEWDTNAVPRGVSGASIAAGDSDSVVTNGDRLDFTWNTNAAAFNTNAFALAPVFVALNSNFLLLSNDLRINQSYMLGGCVSNQFTNICWDTDGTATNAGLVPALQYNQDLYRTNFVGVNTNTWLTTNLFASIGALLGLTNVSVSGGQYYAESLAYQAWTTNYVQMLTNFTQLPTNLAYAFPNMFHLFDTNVVQPGIVAGDLTVRQEVLAILAELGLVFYNDYTYVPGKYGFSATNSFAYTTNDVQLFQVWPSTNTFPTGSVAYVNAWGGGSSNVYGRPGGYSYGVLTNAGESFDPTIASHVTNGMWLAVQVGGPGGRAAVWRASVDVEYTNFHTMTNEILVAGGAGGGANQDHPWCYGGNGGGITGGVGGVISGVGGGGGLTNAGGAAGTSGRKGHRVWGAKVDGSGAETWSCGGDGYYGGGSRAAGEQGSGGGGSGFVAPSLISGTTLGVNSGTYPMGNLDINSGYGNYAGQPQAPARVVFLRQLSIGD